MRSVLLIGCGYVGKALAKELSSQDYIVTCLVKTHSSALRIYRDGYTCYASEQLSEKEFSQLVQKHDILIVTVAPKVLSEYEDTYLNTALKIKKALHETTGKTLIYTSSTSVYLENSGNTVTEESPLNTASGSSKVLAQTESIYLSLPIDSCVFRLSEIYGPGRELSSKLQKNMEKSFPGNGSNPSNMIHLDDIVQAIVFALKSHLKGVYNLTDDDSLIRKELYRLITEKYKLHQVQWDPSLPQRHSSNKKVSNEKIKRMGYSFKYPHRTF